MVLKTMVKNTFMFQTIELLISYHVLTHTNLQKNKNSIEEGNKTAKRMKWNGELRSPHFQVILIFLNTI